MHVIETLALLVAGLAFMAVLGFPVARLALPRDLYEEYGHVVAAPIGYMVLCLFAFVLSGSAGLPAATATLVVAGAMAAMTVALVVRDRRPAGERLARLRNRSGDIAMLIAPLAVFVLWPLLVNGADTYLGAVNPDYFAGLVDDYFLLKGHSVADFTKGRDTFHPLDYMAGSISSSGRFASGLFALPFTKLLGLDIRTALTLSIALFLCCLPLAMFFFSRVVFGFDAWTGRITAWLIGISAPVTMSYLYFYLGQNSGLAALPLTFAAGFLLLTRPSAGLLVLFSLLVNALLVVYLGMLPYAVAPLGVLGLYLLASRRMPVKRMLALIGGFIAISAAVNFGMLQSLYAMVRGWSNVIGQTLQGQYFLDFLTEAYFPLFLGVVVYPHQSSWYSGPLGPLVLPVALALTVVVGACVVFAGVRWARETPDRARVVTVLAAVAIYSAVWWVYSFQRQYGYAVFKMASWLQFLLVPFVAFGWLAVSGGAAKSLGAAGKTALALGFALYVFTNASATVEYGVKGMGRDPINSYIINNFEMSGNRDYFGLPRAVAEHVRPGESVGLAFVDSIQNFWVSYYLRNTRLSLLSHENIPGDDENLPDIATNRIVDYYGNVRDANNVFFHGAADDLYLTWNETHVNRDIASPRYSAPPVWQNRTFRLYRAADNPDMVFTGRGFYRVEYGGGARPYWWPDRFRWTAQGGEVYLLRPSQPGAPYRIAFDAIVGFEHQSDARTVELWADKVKFDEFVVTSAARHVSRPFIPSGPVTKIVIRVRERVPPGRRVLPLWNRTIPFDYRQLNIVLADIRVAPDGPPPAADSSARACGRRLQGNDILHCARAFNGVQIDRWIGRQASILLPANAGVSKITVRGLVPGSLGFAFPYKIHFRVNGADIAQEVAKPGDFSIDLPVAQPSSPGGLAIEVRPGQSVEMKEEFRVRRKLVTQALRLDSLELQ